MCSYLMLLIKVLQYILGLLDKSKCALTAHMPYTRCKLCRQICHVKCPIIYTVKKGVVAPPQRLRAHLFFIHCQHFFFFFFLSCGWQDTWRYKIDVGQDQFPSCFCEALIINRVWLNIRIIVKRVYLRTILTSGKELCRMISSKPKWSGFIINTEP